MTQRKKKKKKPRTQDTLNRHACSYSVNIIRGIILGISIKYSLEEKAIVDIDDSIKPEGEEKKMEAETSGIYCDCISIQWLLLADDKR